MLALLRTEGAKDEPTMKKPKTIPANSVPRDASARERMLDAECAGNVRRCQYDQPSPFHDPIQFHEHVHRVFAQAFDQSATERDIEMFVREREAVAFDVDAFHLESALLRRRRISNRRSAGRSRALTSMPASTAPGSS